MSKFKSSKNKMDASLLRLLLPPPCAFDSTDQSGDISVHNYPELSKTLPNSYEYHLCSFSRLEDGFDAVLRVALNDEAGATKWLADYQEESRITLRVLTTKPQSGRVNLFKVYYRCHHNTLPRSERADLRPKSKNTKCPAQVVVTVKRIPGKQSRAKVKDPHLPKFATVVWIQHTHNHEIISADALKFRDVSEEVTAKFIELFSKGHSPSSALDTHKLDLQLEHGTDYLFEAADRAKCPDIQFCHRLYKKIFNKSYSATGEKMLHCLEASIKSYNQEQGLECCKMDQVNGKLAIAVCTPLMRRIHTKHQCSGEVVFVDSSPGLKCRLFMILTHSAAGGLPLGCLITTSESQETFVLALKLYTQIVPDDAFYGRGHSGPVVFLTDDSDSERQSLKELYPESFSLLCVFHLLQIIWRFLWDEKNSVRPEHRPYLLGLFQDLLYSNTSDDLEWKYAKLTGDAVARGYNSFLKHAARLYDHRQLWAVCFRQGLPLCGSNTTNYVEAAMRILKDQIFQRVRAYNPVQLLDYLLTRIVGYYGRRLNDLACGRIDVTVSRRYLPGSGGISAEMVTPLEFTFYEVRSASKADKKYQVDMALAMCTCNAGINGAPCKHQYAVVKYYKVHSFNFLPITDERMLPIAVSTRQEHAPGGWSVLPPAGPSTTPQGNESPDDVPNHQEQEHAGETKERSHFSIGHPRRELSLDDLEAGLEAMTRGLIKRLRASPQELAPAVDTYLIQHKRLKTNSATVAALMTFGKYTGAAGIMAFQSKRKGKS